MTIKFALCVPVLALATGCATTGTGVDYDDVVYQSVRNPGFDKIAAADDKAGKDRLAILAMQGEYRVDFHFEETVPLKDGYEPRDEKDSGGYEVVLVLDDKPDKVVLQHLLVMPGGAVVKHWRQDWTYEAAHRFDYAADQTWDVVSLPEGSRTGQWTQCVYEVSDAPRYCGTGRWNHRYGVSTWTSDRSWRPLPRREYTTRDDYNVMNVENRHTVTANGWTHEQDNTKTIRDGRETAETLVREFGFNDYRSITGYDFEPAREYWEKTSEYWSAVRAAWERRLVAGNTLIINTEVDGMPIITGTFAQAANADSTMPEEEQKAIEALLDEYTESRSSVLIAGQD